MKMVDLYCGGGLVSLSLAGIGFKVILGVDNNSTALKFYKLNAPHSKAELSTLGPETDFEWPPDDDDIFVWASPPCTDISSAQTRPVGSGELILRWTVKELSKRYKTWVVETSNTDRVKKELAALKETYSFSWTRVCASEMGSPQTRRRIFIGPIWLIERLNAWPRVQRPVSVREAFTQAGIVPRGDFVKNNSSSREGTNLRPISMPSFTICASRQINWGNGSGETIACMNVAEGACLMGFGNDLNLQLGAKDAQRVLGNGVCRQVAEVVGKCARGDEPPTPENQPQNETELLKKRVNELEERTRDLERKIARLEKCND